MIAEDGFPNHFKAEEGESVSSSEYHKVYRMSGSTIYFDAAYFSWNSYSDLANQDKIACVTEDLKQLVRVHAYGDKHRSTSYFNLPKEFVEVISKGDIQNKLKKMEEKKNMREVDYTGVVEEMISKVDKQKMKRILSSSLQINAKDIAGIDAVLKTWAEAKKDIYLLFDRQLSITVEKEIELSESEKRNYMEELFKEFPVESYFIHRLFSISNEVMLNVVGDSSGYEYLKQGRSDIKRGMKFTQLVHKRFNNEKFEIALSDFYSMTKLKGCVTISIDPIEYMLMSLNSSGWSSCHTLHNQEDTSRISYGCYSAGIFSYMCDDASIIAFRHKKDETDIMINRTKIKAFSKSWRQMVYLNLDERVFICSRQYPCENAFAEKVVREMLEEILSNKFTIPNMWVIKKNKNYIQRYIRDNSREDGYALHYNDVLNNFKCSLAYNKQLDNLDDTLIQIGSYPPCPICGEKPLDNHERPMCNHCYHNF